MIVAGDLTLASHDYGKTRAPARRRPKKRPKARKEDPGEAASNDTPPPPLAKATAQTTSRRDTADEVTEQPLPKELTSTSSAPVGAASRTSCADDPSQCPSFSLTAESTSLPPPDAVDIPPPDTAKPRDRESHVSTPAPSTDCGNPQEEKSGKKHKAKDSDRKTTHKKERAEGVKKSKGSRSSRRTPSTRSSAIASSSSRKRTTSSTEIMDPDFRPDPAKRPKIVSPWLEPMPKDTARCMLLRTLASGSSRSGLQQYMLPYRLSCLRPTLLTVTRPRPLPWIAFLMPSAKTSALSISSLTLSLGSAPRLCHFTRVRNSLANPSPSAADRRVLYSLCLGKRLRTARFRQSIPRRQRRFRPVHTIYWSGPQPAWLFTVSRKLIATLYLFLSPRAPEQREPIIPLRTLLNRLRNPPQTKHHCPATRCTAVPGPKSGSNPTTGHMPKASSYLLLLCTPILRGASVRITEPRVGGTVDRHPPEAIHWHTPQATATAKPFGLSFNEAPNLKAIRKRSLLRALRRLDRTGNTTYRGHRFVLPLVDTQSCTPPRCILSHPTGRAQPRIHVMSWNAGGLSSDRYQQLLLWLQGPGKHLHIVAVQETHWRHDATFPVLPMTNPPGSSSW